MLRKIFSHTAIYGLAPHVSKIASFFVLPIITHFLTPLDYGVYGVITATVGSISVFGSLGLRLVLVNSFFKSPLRYKWRWRQIYGFLSLWVFLYALLSSILIFLIIPGEAKGKAWEIIFINVMPLIFFGQTNTIATTYYQVNRKPIPIAIRTIIFGILTVLLNYYTIAVLKMGYMGWFWSTFVVTVLNNISYWIPLNLKLGITPIYKFKWYAIRQNLKVSLPTVPHYYSSYLLNTSDKLVLEFLQVSTNNIGKYNVAYTFGNYFNQLGVASGLAIGPILSDCYKKGEDRKARNLVFLLQVVFFVLTFFACIWMKELFSFFIRNDELNKMYYLGVIIVMSYNYRPMYFGANAKLMYAEKTNLLWKVSFMAGALNVALNLIFVPIFGFEVAAYTTFVSLMYMGYAGFFFKTFKEITDVNYYPWLWLLLTVLFSCGAYILVFQSILVKGVASLIALAFAAYTMKLMRTVIHGGEIKLWKIR